jgi:hypothetical protein
MPPVDCVEAKKKAAYWEVWEICSTVIIVDIEGRGGKVEGLKVDLSPFIHSGSINGKRSPPG